MIGGVLSSSNNRFSGITYKAFQLVLSQSKVCCHVTPVRFVCSSRQLKRGSIDRFLTLVNPQRFRCHFLKNFPVELTCQSALTKMSRHFSMGEGTYQVPMELFDLNRKRLSEKLRAQSDVPKKSLVVLQGGQGLSRYCTDVELAFRQVTFFSYFQIDYVCVMML